MKTYIILLISLTSVLQTVIAQTMRYTFQGDIASVAQTDLEPEHLWGTSIYPGAPITLTIEANLGLMDDFSSPSASGFQPTVFHLSAGNYSFSSGSAFFGLRDNFSTDSTSADGFTFTARPVETYFASSFSIGGFLLTSDTTLLGSDTIAALPSRSVAFDLGPTIAVSATNAEFRFRISEVSAAIIPEPNCIAVILGFSALLYTTRKRWSTGRPSQRR